MRTSPRTSSTAVRQERNPVSKRRSNRMALSATVNLSGQDHHSSFTLPSKATNLNRHGASVQSTRDLPVGSTLVVRNARGAQVAARVVRQISAVDGVLTYGIEFVDQDVRAKEFWGITFPPA